MREKTLQIRLISTMDSKISLPLCINTNHTKSYFQATHSIPPQNPFAAASEYRPPPRKIRASSSSQLSGRLNRLPRSRRPPGRKFSRAQPDALSAAGLVKAPSRRRPRYAPYTRKRHPRSREFRRSIAPRVHPQLLSADRPPPLRRFGAY